MKKILFLIIVMSALVLLFAGCSDIANITAPGTGQDETPLTKGDVGDVILNYDEECLAAPAVAGILLEAVGLDNRYGTGRDGGNYIADVAQEMGPETDFHGIDKCNVEAYRLEVAKFLIGQGATQVTNFFEAELLSVVYEGICNTFGTHAGETMTFTFSNEVVLNPAAIPHPTPIVYFDGISAIGTGPLNWTAEDNQVVITTTGKFITPRPEVGDIVNDLAGIFDVLGNEVIVPVGGLEIEGIVTYDLVGGWKMDMYTSDTSFVDRFVLIDTYIDGNIEGFFGVGYDSNGSATGEITGTVAGQSISFTYDRVGYEDPGYEAYFEGTIEDCDFISGTWNDNRSYQTGEYHWDMYREYY